MRFTDTSWYKVGRTLAKTFLVAFLGNVIAFGAGVLDMNVSEWKAAAAAGIAAVLLASFNALNPSYTDYGIGTINETEITE
jgi:hypothetical protein